MVPIEATTEQLRAEGCGAGWYRLEAIDQAGSAVGIVAFAELMGGGFGEASEGETVSRISVEALARAVEAMQRAQVEREKAQSEIERAQAKVQEERERGQARVQEEREKAQAQIMIALIARLVPSASTTPDPVEVVKKQLDLQKVIDGEAQRRNAALTAAEPRERSIAEDIIQICAVPPVAAALGHLTERMFGSGERPKLVGNDQSKDAQDEARLEAIYSLLTIEEYESFGSLTKHTARKTVDEWIDRLVAGTDEEATSFIRERIATGQGVPSGITPPSGSNGVE